MASPSSQQAERILALLYVLLHSEGLTRGEIYEQVSDYKKAPSDEARRRLFDHDIRYLKDSPFSISVDRERANVPALYRALINGETKGDFDAKDNGQGMGSIF